MPEMRASSKTTKTRTARLFIIAIRVIAISIVIGATIGIAQSDATEPLLDITLGALIGLVISVGSILLETQFFSNRNLRIARHLPPVVVLILRVMAYGLLLLAGLSLPSLLTNSPLAWNDPAFVNVFAISALIAAIFSLAIETTRLLGTEATIALFWGRYTRPRLEERVVMFADVTGSTALAEDIGELKFHDFLRDVMFDISDAVHLSGGEIHKYIGDAVVVTWPQAKGIEDAACLNCAQGMHASIAAKSEVYLKTYGTKAELRIALHCGQLAAGEVGDWKKEIAFLGDTMNTTARIETAAKALGADTALSDALAKILPESTRLKLRRLPSYAAQGKNKELQLWSLDIP